MDQDNKNTSGAPSDDTTSALFVSARKKQLQQQEAERKAKEQEDQRLAAEAEVRRLEAEVEARRYRAQEEARRVEAENAEKKRQAEAEAWRIAEEARARNAQAAVNPDAFLGPQPQPRGPKPMPGPKAPGAGGGAASGFIGNKKLLIFGGGGAVVLIALVVVLVVVLGGGGGSVGSRDIPPVNTPVITPAPTQKPTPAPTVEPEPPDEPDEYDIHGYYYLNGDYGEMSLYFYADGSLDVDYPGGEREEGTYTIDGDEITLDINDHYEYLTIINNEILEDDADNMYIRPPEDEEPPEIEPEEPWEVDKDASFDGVADVSSINMGVRYPTSIFSVVENTDEYLELATYDPNGARYMVRVLDSLDFDTLYSVTVAPIVNSIGANIITSYFAPLGECWIEYENKMDSNAQKGDRIIYTAKLHCDVNGAPLIGVITVTVWTICEKGQPTDRHNIISKVMIYNEPRAAEYGTLFWRFDENMFDA